MDPRRAKLFKNGRSQAVRLPKGFRFEGDEVLIHREGRRVILEPAEPTPFGDDFWALFGAFADDFDVGDRRGTQKRDLEFP